MSDENGVSVEAVEIIDNVIINPRRYFTNRDQLIEWINEKLDEAGIIIPPENPLNGRIIRDIARKQRSDKRSPVVLNFNDKRAVKLIKKNKTVS
jgi:hypothetical protein